MKHKILSFLTAFAMVLGVIAAPFANVNAAGEKDNVSTDPNAVTESVTLHKLMMTKDELKKWDSDAIEKKGYDGTQDLTTLKGYLEEGHSAKEVPGVYFALKFAEGDNNGKYVKKGTDAKTPANPLEATDNVEEAVGGLTTTSGFKFNTSKLSGNFEIVEVKEKSNYKSEDGKTIVDQKAVPVEITLPLVNEDGTVVNAHVYPKNTEDKPEIDKNFQKKHGLKIEEDTNTNADSGAAYENYAKDKAKASATVGKNIPYEVKTKIAAGTSYENLTWNDTMTNGLTYNKDLKVTADNDITFTEEDYKLVQDASGFRLQMTEAGLNKIKAVTIDAEEQKDVNITLTYTATINGSAVVDNPEKNNVTLEYGHKPGKDLEEKPVTPKEGNLKVNKTFAPALGETDGLSLVYTLKNDNGEIASVQLDNTKTSGTIDLGNGITFEIESAFNGTFKGLPEGTNYKITERVAGYDPAYAETNQDGEVTITNKKDNDNPTPLEPTTPEVVTGGKKFVKTDNNDKATAERLAGAKFAVKNSENKYLAAKSEDTVEAEKAKLKAAQDELDKAVKAYNERKDDTKEVELKKAIDDAQAKFNQAFKKAGVRYEWANSKDADGVVVLSSDSQGRFEIQGLEYGKYSLEEIEAPKGFAKISDQNFTVEKGSYAGAETEMEYTPNDAENSGYGQQIKNKKVTIPQTGGIGSIIFVVAGLMIMGLAAYKMKANKEQA